MCCLFGLLDYKQSLSLNQRKRILRTLSIACEERGTDATGIAYFIGKQLSIQKAPRPAHRMKFRIPQNAHYIMGHTRMTTQGTEGKNYNNHPFSGKVDGTTFALAHNGVIHNDKELQRIRNLPPTKIETDSYVAVQLLEQEESLSFKSLKVMAEALRGSFTITVLDQQNNLYIVKGNNPMCIYRFEKGFYLYASTESILQKAVDQLGLAQAPHQVIQPDCGDILCIKPDGTMETGYFDDTLCFPRFDYGLYHDYYYPYFTLRDFGGLAAADGNEEELLDDYAGISGIDRTTLQLLRDGGFDWLEIEEMIYDRELLEECLGDLRWVSQEVCTGI